MISISIDGVEISTISPTTITLSNTAATMRSVDSAAANQDFNFDMEIGVTDIETLLSLSSEGYLHDGVPFNQSLHTGEILCEGVVVASGNISLVGTTVKANKVVYKLRLRCSGAEWATHAQETLIHEVSLEYSERLDTSTIESSWTDDSFIKYLPVHRDSYSSTYSTESISTVQRIRSVDDYHPFIHVYTLMQQIFTEGGYTVNSDFMDSTAFKKLYISGDYISQSSSEAEAVMDFYAVKMEDRSTTADYRGRVNISPLYSYNSVGYLVDLESIDSMAECYSLGGCLSVESAVLTFTPTQSVSVGFEVRLLYVSDYQIESRTSLKAFDSLYLDGSMTYDYGVANTFIDQRDETIEKLFEYLVVVFNGSSSQTYQLSIMINGVETYLNSWVGTSGEVTTPSFSTSDTVVSPKLYAVSSSGVRTQYTSDWAMYMGYINFEGEVEIDVTVRTPPQTASPSSPISLTAPYIDGAESGMSFTLKSGTSLKPYFAGYPGFGSQVEYSDLSQHDFYASDFIESMQHLFNLAIFSDKDGGQVFIEPEEDIYDSSTVWDWSDKIVESEEITFTDVAVDGSQVRKWGYQSSDGVTTRIAGFYYEPGETYPDAPTADPAQSVEGASCPEYGTWVVDIGSYVAEDKTNTELNPILSPTINDTLGLPIVGDREDPDMADTLEFSPRILSLEGMMYSDNELIPNAVFFSQSMGVNLCFEDRDGLTGLNKYYREMVERESSGRYVELSLSLTPNELASLATPMAGSPNMLSTFGLTISGEWCEARLEQIEMVVGVKSPTAKCKFLITK